MAKPLRIPLLVDSKQLRKGLAEAEGNLKGFATGAAKVFAGVTAAGVGALGAFAIGGAKKFVELEKKVREVGTLLGDVSRVELGELTRQIETVATAYGQAATDVSTAFYDSISAGVAQQDVEAFVADAAKFATAGATEIGSAVDLLTSAINAFGLESTDATRVSDVFFGTVKAGKTTVTELGASFSNMGPIAAAAGISLEEVGGALAAMTLQGTPTAQASTQIQRALGELMKSGSKANVFFEQTAKQTFPEFIAAGGSLVDVVALMDQGMVEAGKGVTDVFGSIQAAAGFLALGGENFERFSGIVDGLGDAAGSTEQAFDTMSESASFQLGQLREELDASQRAVGSSLIPLAQVVLPDLVYGMQAMTPRLASVVQGFAEWAAVAYDRTLAALQEANYWAWRVGGAVGDYLSEQVTRYAIPAFEALARTIHSIAGPWKLLLQVGQALWEHYGDQLLPALHEVVKWFGETYRVVSGQVEPTLRVLEGAFNAVTAVIATVISNGLQPVQAAVAPVLTAWDWLIEKIGSIGGGSGGPTVVGRFSGLVEFWEDHLKPAIMAVSEFFTEVLAPALQHLATLIGDIISGLVTFIKERFDWLLEILDFVWTLIVETISLALDTITAVFKIATGIFTGDWGKAWEGIKHLAQGASDALTNIFKKLVGVLTGLWRELGEILSTMWGNLWELIKRGFTAAWDGIIALFKGYVNMGIGLWEGLGNAFIKAINWIIQKWNNFGIDFPGVKVLGVQVVPAFSWSTPNLPGLAPIRIPRLAEGGLVTRPTLALVGEAGPELVVPLDQAGQHLPGNTLIVNFYGDVYGDEYSLGDLVVEALTDWQRRNGPLDLTTGRA